MQYSACSGDSTFLHSGFFYFKASKILDITLPALLQYLMTLFLLFWCLPCFETADFALSFARLKSWANFLSEVRRSIFSFSLTTGWTLRFSYFLSVFPRFLFVVLAWVLDFPRLPFLLVVDRLFKVMLGEENFLVEDFDEQEEASWESITLLLLLLLE